MVSDRTLPASRSYCDDGVLGVNCRASRPAAPSPVAALGSFAVSWAHRPVSPVRHQPYVTDGYRNARVHRFNGDGRLVKSSGERGHGAGQFHLPHTIAFDDDGKLYVGDRSNKRIQIFTPEGEYLSEWTGMGGPNDISRGRDGNFYIAEQEDAGKPACVCVRDGQGNVLARLESRHVHGVGVDSRGDIYAGLTQDRSVDKFVRVG